MLEHFQHLKSCVFCGIWISEDDQVSYGKRNVHWKGEPGNCFQSMDDGKLRDYSMLLIKAKGYEDHWRNSGMCLQQMVT